MSPVQRQKDKLLLVSAQEFMEHGELASKALNAVSPHMITLWQHQQSQVLYKHDAGDSLAMPS